MSDGEINIIYNIERGFDYITIFGSDFVKENKKNVK